MILVTGASGTVGKAVLNEVARSGAKHKAMYRSAEEAAKAPAGTATRGRRLAAKASRAATGHHGSFPLRIRRRVSQPGGSRLTASTAANRAHCSPLFSRYARLP
jgi:uncharacterized protein YbjT (DUF2867 family)